MNTYPPPPPPAPAIYAPDLDRILNLDALRSRLVHLADSLNDFLQLHDNASWPVVLSQFNVLVARYETLLREMRTRKEWMSANIVIPSAVIADAPDWIPNVLLRTRVDPDLETESNLLRAKYPPSQPNPLDEQAISDTLGVLAFQIQEHDEQITELLRMNAEQDLAGELKARLPPDASTPATVAAAVNPESDKAALQKALMWMSSGPESWEEERRRREERERQEADRRRRTGAY
ncbi:hypothetical protein HDU86_001429 [Geranomyces michiganensis]|nr:hypothetical protein HDU86_001429 [Geranomyces michiganensis]